MKKKRCKMKGNADLPPKKQTKNKTNKTATNKQTNKQKTEFQTSLENTAQNLLFYFLPYDFWPVWSQSAIWDH